VATLHPKDIKAIIEDDDELHKRLHRYVELKQRLTDLAVTRPMCPLHGYASYVYLPTASM
jgi:hypothetical protein